MTTARSRALWITGLLLALLYVGADSIARSRAQDELQTSFSGRPGGDDASPTGYAHGQRSFVTSAVDGMHWIMQTQAMLAGDGARIRRVDYDNAPAGREVHWSSPFRWWIAALARVNSAATGETVGRSVERAAPIANVLIFAALVVMVGIVVARRFGSLASAATTMSMAAIKPFVTTFAFGNVDHHGIAAGACMLAVLFLLVGVGDPKAARRWFIAGGIAGGIGLWVSAATITPVLIAVAIGALLAAVATRKSPEIVIEPALWRIWGLAGGATSLAAYLIEYFPSHLGWRLEVNHPLFAAAWIGGGEILHRVTRALSGRRAASGARDAAILALAIVGALLLPIAIATAPARTFWVSDRFLWALHTDYIAEFGPFMRYWNAVPWSERWSNVSFLPIVIAATLVASHRSWTRDTMAAFALALPAAVVTMILAFQQTRWWGVTDAVWIAMIPTTCAIASVALGRFGRRTRVAIVVCALAMVVLPNPLLAIRDWMRDGLKAPIEFEDITQLVVRDVAQTLRARSPNAGVILSAPSSTTPLIFFSGMRGIGTLYWENLPGLRTAAAIYAAPSADSARVLVERHGVTHLVFFSWDFFARELALLAHGQHPRDPVDENAFVWRMFRTGEVPAWLREVPYVLPREGDMEKEWVKVFEVLR